jgi:hypothetical protein
VADTAGADARTRDVLVDGDACLGPVLLGDRVEGRSVLVGLALLASSATPPRAELTRAIARGLLAAGDGVARAADG